MTGIQRPLETSTIIRPIQLFSGGALSPTPAPLIRVRTCGSLTLEIVQEIVNLDPPQARYTILTPDLLHGRGVAPSLTLLKLLVSRPQRFAPADWLREQFCRAQKEAFSSKRLDTLDAARPALPARVRSAPCLAPAAHAGHERFGLPTGGLPFALGGSRGAVLVGGAGGAYGALWG